MNGSFFSFSNISKKKNLGIPMGLPLANIGVSKDLPFC